MLKNYNLYNVLKLFLFSPTESFRLREISRLTKIAPKSVMNYLKEFINSGLIKRYEKRGIPIYQANMEKEEFKEYKRIAILSELAESGITEYLWHKFSPEAIIFYGSYARGESTEESDIDIFLLGVDVRKEKIDIKKFEEKIGIPIDILGEKSLKEIPSKEFKNNLANGIILKGYLKLL